jgi:hypothetical protein
MSPEERQLLSELFDRVRAQSNAPRDRDAENFIADAVRAQPYAPYLLAQAVIVQDHALRAADQKIQELQAEIGHLQQQAQSAAPQGGGSFLGGLFGGGRQAPQPQPSPWGVAPQPQAYAPPPPPQGFAPPQPGPAPSPWGAPQAAQGGGFLRNAMGAAAGVAGGMLLVDSLKGLFSGGGHAGGLGGAGLFGGGLGGQGLGGQGLGGQGLGGGETIVNNYYDSPQSGHDAGMFDDHSGANDPGLSNADDSGDDFSGDDFSGDDNSITDV